MIVCEEHKWAMTVFHKCESQAIKVEWCWVCGASRYRNDNLETKSYSEYYSVPLNARSEKP